MGRETQKKGDLGVALAIAKLTQLGYDVSVPLSESAAYDLLADTPNGIKRIQVRYTTKNGVGLRRIHSNAAGYVVKRKVQGSYDWLIIVRSDGKIFLIEEASITKINQITPTADHEI